MIAHLRGTLLVRTPNRAILECNGVGYEVAISVATFSALPEEGAEARLNIFTKVAEDQLALFGFAEIAEKQLFEKLLTISGIGPKLAITVLSGVSADRLVAAIRGGDHATLVKIPGIGKKTAERIVLELKDKLEELIVPGPGGTEMQQTQPHSRFEDDVLSALTNLGYAKPASQRAIDDARARNPDADQAFESLFRSAMAAIR